LHSTDFSRELISLGEQAHENKPIVFENWIKSDLIYVNDILDSTKTLSSKFILEKLKFKSNWIANLISFNVYSTFG
jgi:hypothetical protein